MREIKKTATATMSKLISAIAVSLLAIVASFAAASPASADPVDNMNLQSLSSPHGGWGAEVWASAKNSTGQLAVLIKYHPQGLSYWDNSYALEKYNADASLDTSFGTNGVVDLPYDSGHDLQILSNNRILVAGGYYDWNRAEIRAARVDVFQNDGSYDTSFGTNGYQYIAGASAGGDIYPDIHQVTALSSGKLAILLTYRNFNREYQFVQVFQIRNADGSFYQAYGQNGEVELSAPAGSRELETSSFTIVNSDFVVSVGYKTEPDGQQCYNDGWMEMMGMPPECWPVPAPVVQSTLTVPSDGVLSSGNPASATYIGWHKARNASVLLGIRKPLRNGGSAITGYQYTLNDGATWSAVSGSTGNSKTLAIAGLTNGTHYTIKVRAVNGAGGGAASNAHVFTPRTVASAPVITSLTAEQNAITVNFDAPSDNGGSEVTRYSCSLNGTRWRFCFEDVNSPQVLSGLKNGKIYSIRIRALNASGWSAASNSLEAAPQK